MVFIQGLYSTTDLSQLRWCPVYPPYIGFQQAFDALHASTARGAFPSSREFPCVTAAAAASA